MQEQFLTDISQHQGLIHKICRIYRDSKEDREDLFQEITYQLWKSYPHFQGRSKLSTWMYRIGLNTAMATFRKPRIATSSMHDNLERFAGQEEQSGDDHRERLYWAIRQMNEADKALISLYLEDFTYKEMAEIIGISENYVGVRLNRIKEKIKHLLTH